MDKNLLSNEEGEMVRAWCDAKNKEIGKISIRWLKIRPEDEPDHLIGINSESNEIIGPNIYVGKKYRIVYSSPVRLPFILSGEGAVAYHVAEIKGTLTYPFTLSDVECVICKPDDYSVKETMRATKSVFRLFVGDKIEEQ